MADTKHTPGPWTQYGRTEFKPFIKDAQGEPVCEASWSMKTSDEAQANARLIAAAPELLEACLASHNAKTQSDLDRAVKMIEAAIAKAKGE